MKKSISVKIKGVEFEILSTRKNKEVINAAKIYNATKIILSIELILIPIIAYFLANYIIGSGIGKGGEVSILGFAFLFLVCLFAVIFLMFGYPLFFLNGVGFLSGSSVATFGLLLVVWVFLVQLPIGLYFSNKSKIQKYIKENLSE